MVTDGIMTAVQGMIDQFDSSKEKNMNYDIFSAVLQWIAVFREAES